MRILTGSISLRRRLQFALLSLFACGIVAASSYFYFDTHGTYEAVRERTLQQQARELLNAGPPSGKGAAAVNVPPGWADDYTSPASGFAFTYYDAEGHVVATSANLDGRAPLPLTDAPRSGRQFGRIHFLGPHAVPALTVRASGKSALLVVARADPKAEALAESLFEERVEPIYVALPFGIAALLLALAIIGWSLRPLERASRQAAGVGPHDLARRIATDDIPVEIRPLVNSFNEALDRLATAYEAERRFTADAAHELRTPISILSLRLQRAKLDDTPIPWATIEQDVRRLTAMVSRLLELARRESGTNAPPPHEPIDFGRIVRSAAASLLPMVEVRGRTIAVVTPDDPVLIDGSAAEMTEMIVILIENGIVHGKGEVFVHLTAEDDAVLVVSDEGPGIPDDLGEAAFDRFRKGSAQAPGSGLGLAIARKIAETHGGCIACSPDSKGGIEVRLPHSSPSLKPD